MSRRFQAWVNSRRKAEDDDAEYVYEGKSFDPIALLPEDLNLI